MNEPSSSGARQIASARKALADLRRSRGQEQLDERARALRAENARRTQAALARQVGGVFADAEDR